MAEQKKGEIFLAYRHLFRVQELMLEGDQQLLDKDGTPDHPHEALHSYLAENNIVRSWPCNGGDTTYALKTAEDFANMDIDDWRACMTALNAKISGARDRGKDLTAPSTDAKPSPTPKPSETTKSTNS